jgi:ornithine cyclodeaminase
VVLILSDTDVARSCTASRSIAVMRRALHAHGEGRLSAPPRTYNDIAPGRLVYTAGALEGLVHGVRIYDHADSEQVVAVWDSPSRRLAAVILGAELGRRRTGAIGAVALDTLARPDAATLGIVGTGHQAWTQVWAATAVRNWSHVKVYSRNPYWRERFAARCREQLLVDAEPVANPRTAFRHRDAMIIATNSPTPVFDTAWLEPGMHITSVGPKSLSAHEVPLDLLDRVELAVTDSLAQVHGYAEPYALSTRRMVELGAILAGSATGRTDPEQISLFCSVGLAGTEVILAADLAGLTTVLPPREVAPTPPAVSPAVIDALSAPTDLERPSLDGAGTHAAIPSQPTVETEAAAEALGDEKAEVPGQAEPPFAEATSQTLDGNEANGLAESAAETGDARDTTAEPPADATEGGDAVADVGDANPDAADVGGAEGAPEDVAGSSGAPDEAATEATDDSAEGDAEGRDAEGRDAGHSSAEAPQDESTAHVDHMEADESDGDESLPPALAELMSNADEGEEDAPSDAARSGDESETGQGGTEATARTDGSTEGESEVTSMTADDDAAIAALQKAAARVVRPSGKKNRPRSRR